VFPVDCKATIADSIKCIIPFEDVMTMSSGIVGKVPSYRCI
jgi:hypothetical protein